jgi:hypothetical protein
VLERGDGLKRLLAKVVLLNISPKNHITEITLSFKKKEENCEENILNKNARVQGYKAETF